MFSVLFAQFLNKFNHTWVAVYQDPQIYRGATWERWEYEWIIICTLIVTYTLKNVKFMHQAA